MSNPLPFANRKTRRAAQKLERTTGGVIVHPDELESLRNMQVMFMACVKEHGRLRVSEKTLEQLTQGDRVKSRREGEHIILTYASADTAEEGAPG